MGRQLQQSVYAFSQPEVIYEANSWIKENYRQPFTVEELAAQRSMSVSLFHQKFKDAVGMEGTRADAGGNRQCDRSGDGSRG